VRQCLHFVTFCNVTKRYKMKALSHVNTF